MGFGSEPQRGSEPPATFLRRSRPGVSGGAPNDSIKPTGLVSPLRPQICLNPVWQVGSEGSRSEPERSEAERSEAAGPEPTQPNWIQTNLATKGRDQTGGLIES